MALYFRTGFRVYASFFGQRIDTSWLGKLQKDTSYAIDGLYWSQRLAVHCHESENVGELGEKISGKINEIMDVIQDPIAKEVGKLAAKLNGMSYEHYMDADFDFLGFPRSEDGWALGYEAFKTAHSLERVIDLEEYVLEALPETPEMCRAEEAWADKHFGGTGFNCSNIDQDTTFNAEKQTQRLEEQEQKQGDLQECKALGTCKKPKETTSNGEATTTTPSSNSNPPSGTPTMVESVVEDQEACKVLGKCKPPTATPTMVESVVKDQEACKVLGKCKRRVPRRVHNADSTAVTFVID